MTPRPEVFLGDVIQTKKPHPCGESRWEVIRVGADVKLKCLGCRRIIMLPYEEFAKRWKRTVSHNEHKTEPRV